MVAPALATREMKLDECTLSPVNIYIANVEEVKCCNHSGVHRHNTFEVVWLAKGRITFYLDFTSYDLEAGSLMFIAPGQIHNWINESPDAEVLSFFFATSIFSTYGQDLRAVIERLPFYTSSRSPILQISPEFRETFDFMFRTALHRLHTLNLSSDRLLLSYLNVILAEADQIVERVFVAVPVNAALQLVQDFRRALEQYFVERKQVQDYADMLGVTANHLVETVREMTGYTPGHLIQERLMLEAKRLLVFTSLSNAEIAYRLSFKNPSQFGHWFREREELSPGAFRSTFAIP